MKPVLSGLLAVLLSSMVAAPQAADGPERGVNQRWHDQQQRMHQGARQGDLTRGETRQLQHQARDMNNIHHERYDGERHFGRDGRHYGFGSGHAYGHSSTRAFDRRVDHIQHEQRQRIAQGLRSGALTRQEARQLMAEQRAIEAEQQRYRTDGVVTRAERVDLLQDLNAAARHIYNESHDAQTRR